MPDTRELIATTAERHNLSRSAVQALSDALAKGYGGAQWNHPDLGGMGQWTRSGMLQIGDMFNHGLKARVGAALEDLAGCELTETPGPAPSPEAGGRHDWWPVDLGVPSSTGAQDGLRYACFPDKRRLVVERDGKPTVYDTGTHRLTGFAQAQSGVQTLEFSGPDGRVSLDDLTVVA